MSLKSARDERDSDKRPLKEGRDPISEAKRTTLTNRLASTNTFEQLAREWYVKQLLRWKPIHAKDVIESLERDVFDDLGSLPVSAIGTAEVLATLRKVEARDAIETAHRLRQRISAIFAYGIGEGRVSADPALSLGKVLTAKPPARRWPAVTTIKKAHEVLIGYFHVDLAEVRTEQGKLYLLVAIDRTAKFAFVELHEKATHRVAGDFLRHLSAAVPYRIHTVLTDNGTHFTEPTGDGWTPKDIKEMQAQQLPFRCHSFELACADLDIEHRLTKPRHPWTNCQVERMNRTIKEATVKRFHYEMHDQLRQHLTDFVAAYNFARRLKTLRGLTPCVAICKAWTGDPGSFISNPHHQSPGPNI